MAWYLDGPCDKVEVLRCGVTTAIGSVGGEMLPFEADLRDSQTMRLTALADEMQAAILAWPWQNEEREELPSPAP